MKLVIMIPCLNEEKTLPTVLESIPNHIKGIDTIETVIINDGSTDKTVEVAKSYGIKHFVNHARNRGLAHSFRDGLRAALELGADIIVLTDGDNQYPQDRIPDLIEPIITGKADIVIADRNTDNVEHYSALHKFLQRFGTYALNAAAGTKVPDATSGFRAWSRSAAQQLNLVTRYSFGMETIIQAGQRRHAIATIDIKTNPKTRESRLFKTPLQHARRQSLVISRSFIMFHPYKFFWSIAGILLIIGLIPFLHYLYVVIRHIQPYGAHHLQSLIIGTVFLMASFMTFMLGVVADLVRMNRMLEEDMLEELRRLRQPSDTLYD